MSHWFHRNPIKATYAENFALAIVPSRVGEARKISSQLKDTRKKLLQLIADPAVENAVFEAATLTYLSLLRGLIESPDDSGGESKLKTALVFKWTNSLHGKSIQALQDAQFEMVHMLVNIALRYSKRSALIAASDSITTDQAKEVHTCLRTSAGIFQMVKNSQVSLLEDHEYLAASDLDSVILDAYIDQTTAEALEVTLARAVEGNHNATLITSIANSIAQTMKTTLLSLKTLNDTPKTSKVNKWMSYIAFKESFYQAYTFCYYGMVLLDTEKCGEAVKCLREAERLYEDAYKKGQVYSKTAGPGANAKPWLHPFFTKLLQKIKLHKDKVERENGFIYFQKIPDFPPEVDVSQPTYGLVVPIEFSLPAISPLWNANSYLSFSVIVKPSEVDKEKMKSDADKQKIDPVVEREIPGTTSSKSDSGCSIQ